MTKTMEVRQSPDEQSTTDKVVTHHYDSRELFAGKQEILIRHGGQSYRLRITRQGKLILTK